MPQVVKAKKLDLFSVVSIDDQLQRALARLNEIAAARAKQTDEARRRARLAQLIEQVRREREEEQRRKRLRKMIESVRREREATAATRKLLAKEDQLELVDLRNLFSQPESVGIEDIANVRGLFAEESEAGPVEVDLRGIFAEPESGDVEDIADVRGLFTEETQAEPAEVDLRGIFAEPDSGNVEDIAEVDLRGIFSEPTETEPVEVDLGDLFAEPLSEEQEPERPDLATILANLTALRDEISALRTEEPESDFDNAMTNLALELEETEEQPDIDEAMSNLKAELDDAEFFDAPGEAEKAEKPDKPEEQFFDLPEEVQTAVEETQQRDSETGGAWSATLLSWSRNLAVAAAYTAGSYFIGSAVAGAVATSFIGSAFTAQVVGQLASQAAVGSTLKVVGRAASAVGLDRYMPQTTQQTGQQSGLVSQSTAETLLGTSLGSWTAQLLQNIILDEFFVPGATEVLTGQWWSFGQRVARVTGRTLLTNNAATTKLKAYLLSLLGARNGLGYAVGNYMASYLSTEQRIARLEADDASQQELEAERQRKSQLADTIRRMLGQEENREFFADLTRSTVAAVVDTSVGVAQQQATGYVIDQAGQALRYSPEASFAANANAAYSAVQDGISATVSGLSSAGGSAVSALQGGLNAGLQAYSSVASRWADNTAELENNGNLLEIESQRLQEATRQLSEMFQAEEQARVDQLLRQEQTAADLGAMFQAEEQAQVDQLLRTEQAATALREAFEAQAQREADAEIQQQIDTALRLEQRAAELESVFQAHQNAVDQSRDPTSPEFAFRQPQSFALDPQTQAQAAAWTATALGRLGGSALELAENRALDNTLFQLFGRETELQQTVDQLREQLQLLDRESALAQEVQRDLAQIEAELQVAQELNTIVEQDPAYQAVRGVRFRPLGELLAPAIIESGLEGFTGMFNNLSPAVANWLSSNAGTVAQLPDGTRWVRQSIAEGGRLVREDVFRQAVGAGQAIPWLVPEAAAEIYPRLADAGTVALSTGTVAAAANIVAEATVGKWLSVGDFIKAGTQAGLNVLEYNIRPTEYQEGSFIYAGIEAARQGLQNMPNPSELIGSFGGAERSQVQLERLVGQAVAGVLLRQPNEEIIAGITSNALFGTATAAEQTALRQWADGWVQGIFSAVGSLQPDDL